MELKPQAQDTEALLRPLLIVPYGIETREYLGMFTWRVDLLIVPYGIETIDVGVAYLLNGAFNCTLWN